MKRLVATLLTAISGMFSACGGGNGNDALDEAWAFFERGSYDSAYVAFSLLTLGGNKEGAYEGLGWTAFRMSQDSLGASNRYFDLAAAGQWD